MNCNRCGKDFIPDITSKYCYDCWEWYLRYRPDPNKRGNDPDSLFANDMDTEDIHIISPDQNRVEN